MWQLFRQIALVLLFFARVASQTSVPVTEAAVPPIYPQIAHAASVTGTVEVRVLIDANGKVASVKSASGPLMLKDAATIAARRWRFATGSADREESLRFIFELTDPPTAEHVCPTIKFLPPTTVLMSAPRRLPQP